MIQKCRAMKMFLSSAVVLLLFVTVHSAEEVTNVDANPSKGNDDNNNNNPAMLPSYHPKVKRAWNQLQAGWGKRSENEIEDESIDQLQQRLMRMYADQLLANRLVDDDSDYVNVNGDYVDKRAKWSQLQNGWGKRDWNQLRGK